MRSKKAIYNIISNLFLQIIVILYGLIIPKIIISNFGSNVNGLVSSITQFLSYITLLESGFGPVLKAALYKPIAQNDKNSIENILISSEKFFKRISQLFIVYIFLLVIFYPLLINKQFSFLYSASLILIIAISIFAEYYFGMTYRIYLQAMQKTYIISIIQILTYLVNIVIVLIFAYLGASIHIIKLLCALIFTLRPIIQNIYVHKKYKLNLLRKSSDYKIEQKWDGLAQHIAYVIHSNTDITILTIFSKLTEVSVYSVYYLVVNGVKALIQIFTIGIDASFGDMIAKNEFENLNKKFEIYELLCHSINTICFSCAAILIVPFVTIYTKNVIDANYVRNTFGLLLVISEFIWATRLPYSTLISASGHFKETRNGAWIECVVNITLSILLVKRFGLVGVVIGTIVAMTIRTFEFLYHTNKFILKKDLFNSIKKVLIATIEFTVIIIMSKYIHFLENTTFINWIINALITFIYSSVIVLVINSAIFKKEFVKIVGIFKKISKGDKKNEKKNISCNII